MTLAAFRKHSLSAGATVVFGSTLLLGTLAAPAIAAESPTAVSPTAPLVRGATGRQLWRISDYTTIELVAREPGAPANEHPWTIVPNTLHALLQQVQTVREGAAKPLFAIDELNNIVPALADALAHARPDQDIALVSSARHEDNSFYSITAVTARLFVVGGQVNLIVHDARVDFYDTTRGSGMAPHFTLGSRAAQGTATLQSASATNKRADWLVLAAGVTPPEAPAVPRAAAPVAAPAPVPVPAAVAPTVAAPVAPAAPQVVAPVAPPPAAVLVPAAPVTPAAPASGDAEQRLLTIKHLYDKGLLTKAEYEKKRAEIIKGL